MKNQSIFTFFFFSLLLLFSCLLLYLFSGRANPGCSAVQCSAASLSRQTTSGISPQKGTSRVLETGQLGTIAVLTMVKL
ncbi:hypothetical protein BDW71DRAFT_184755 [Aspergillus fruticulosus]